MHSHRLNLPAAPSAQHSLNSHIPSPEPSLVVGQVYTKKLAQISAPSSAHPEQPLTRAWGRLDSAWGRMGKAKPAARSQSPNPLGGDSSAAGGEGIPAPTGKRGQSHRAGTLPLELNHTAQSHSSSARAQPPCSTPHPTGMVPQIPGRISYTITHLTVVVSISNLWITNPSPLDNQLVKLGDKPILPGMQMCWGKRQPRRDISIA